MAFDDRTHSGEVEIEQIEHAGGSQSFGYTSEIANVAKKNGNVSFFATEGSITKAFLESHPNETLPIKQPTKYAFEGGVFPTQYRVKYDAAAREYTVSLEGLTTR